MNLRDLFKNKCSGFTFIELLLVIAIVAIVAAMSTPFLSSFIQRSQFQSTKQKIESSLAKAQSYAMQGKNDSIWGICLSGSDILMYSGTCGAPLTEERYALPQTITVTGLTDIAFNGRGEPSTSSTITVANSFQSTDILVNAAGVIAYDLVPTPTGFITPTFTPTPTTPIVNTPTPTTPPVNTPTPTPIPPTNTPTPLPTATFTPTPIPPTNTPTPPTGPLSATIVQTSSTATSFCATITIFNSSNQPQTNWTMTMSRSGYTITSTVNANFSPTATTYVVTPLNFNKQVPKNGSVGSINFCANTTTGFMFPYVISVL